MRREFFVGAAMFFAGIGFSVIDTFSGVTITLAGLFGMFMNTE